MTQTPAKPEPQPTLLERLKANPRFKEAGSPGDAVVIVGAKGRVVPAGTTVKVPPPPQTG